jgi:hypothetical protein
MTALDLPAQAGRPTREEVPMQDVMNPDAIDAIDAIDAVDSVDAVDC